ncbi:MAG TPA: hypothetical protein VL088_07425 [Pedobacter sp.]|nr:hypothetical protein [Pedobacter sp.]
MKTSYKILIAFVTIILISIVAFNISLKAKYRNGDFNIRVVSTEDIYQTYDLDKINLKNFKHVVINGGIITKGGKQINFRPNFLVNDNGHNINTLGIRSNLKPLLRKRMSNDTLYLSFQKDFINEKNVNKLNLYPFVLEVSNLKSITTKDLTSEISNMSSGKPFTISSTNSTININYMATDSLTLNIGTGSYVSLNESRHYIKEKLVPYKIGAVNYHLAKGATLSIVNSDLFGKITCMNPSSNPIESKRKSMSITSPND